MHRYSVYGLAVQSEFSIPELLADESADGRRADIVVRRAESPLESGPAVVAGAGPSQDDSWAERRPESGETLCVFAGVGRYLIRDGQTVLVAPEEGAEFAVVRHLLLGPVLAHLLWQRGIFTLHASVMGVGGLALGFVGASGEGKSTIAAALAAAGHLFVCDDVAALVERDDRVEVLPGFPRIRLHGDTLRSLGEEPAQLPRVHAQIDKRLKCIERFARAPVALDRIYVLASGERLAVERVAAGAAIMEIVRHTYYAHQFAPLYGFKQQLEWATRIAARVPVFRLTRPRDLALLPELVTFLAAPA